VGGGDLVAVELLEMKFRAVLPQSLFEVGMVVGIIAGEPAARITCGSTGGCNTTHAWCLLRSTGPYFFCSSRIDGRVDLLLTSTIQAGEGLMSTDEGHTTSNESVESTGNTRDMSRRALLQAAALTAISLTAASRASAQESATPNATPVISPAPIAAGAGETWTEPWVWRPSDWPGQQLDLNVVENENPGQVVGFGNPGAVIFSYNGATPGPTIRMRGDETLLVRLRNLLGRNHGSTFVGPYPDPAALPDWLDKNDVAAKARGLGQLRSDYCLGEHANGAHSARVTNLHVHGLHVRPGRNPDGTHSDNVLLRVLPQGDLERREAQAGTTTCPSLHDHGQTSYLSDDETVGFADFEFRVGNVQARDREASALPPQAHPPGTHWYHPHTHGATHNQVASGMAGFLIIEGDVDEAINRELTGGPFPDPQLKTGPYDYIERLMLIQRVFVAARDPDAPTRELKLGGAANPVVNGDQAPTTITMRPGAIERWRVLNGSVDGRGYKHVMLLKGQYDLERVGRPGGPPSTTLVKLRDASNGTFSPASRAEIEADKQQLYHLAFDGITLIHGDGDEARYTIQDLAEQNAGTDNPLNRELSGNPNHAMLANYESCFSDAEHVRNTWVRPNEVYLAPGNRSDLLFQAPRHSEGNAEVYTVVARGSVIHSDDYQNALQTSYSSDALAPAPEDIVVAYVLVSEAEGVEPIPEYDVMDLVDVLPELPDYLRPVQDDEIRVKDGADGGTPDPDANLVDRVGRYRTRTITYSGWGAFDYPLVTTEGDSDTARNFREFIERDQANGGELEHLRYARIPNSDEYVLLVPNIRTMAITGGTSDEVVDGSDELFPITANMARKFDPSDPQRPRMLEGTAEEWAVYNASISLWANIDENPLGQSGGHYPGQPLLRHEGQARFAAQPNGGKSWLLQTKSVDHPFHMHQNPYWVMRIEVPDEAGNLVNVLDRPRWQDVVWLPRNGGRVIFRSRFPDYVGTYVNHCHILLHEDNGMMQAVEVTPFADHANYEPKERVTSLEVPAEEISEIYPRLDQEGAWRQSMQVVDPNHLTGQAFPGFVLGSPPTDS
jgi:FtsP/CotA-like multicopper oxidase with cupredoxin domain